MITPNSPPLRFGVVIGLAGSSPGYFRTPSITIFAGPRYKCTRRSSAGRQRRRQPNPAKKPEKKRLTGAELYQVNCSRCHSERYPTEFTPAQWKTIMIHMRVRANLPAAQAREILKYLQEDSGN